MTVPPATLHFRAGCIHAHNWPMHLAPPYGMHKTGTTLTGPARLRYRLRQDLADAGLHFDDASGPLAMAAASDVRARHSTPARPPDLANVLQTLRQSHHRGIVISSEERQHIAIATHLLSLATPTTLILVPDSATAHRWRDQLAALHDLVTILTVQSAARDMHWRGGRHDAVLVDALERMPQHTLATALDECGALARVGIAARLPSRAAALWCARLGPVLFASSPCALPRCEQLHLPMPPDVARQYEATWRSFLSAYDRFAAARGEAGFGTFVRQARGDPTQRPALHAWHESIASAAWHANKAAIVCELLQRHRGQRIVLFTPDRACAYELADRHLVPALTSELPRKERAALLDAFRNGVLPTLAGPRLLDSGIPEQSADVGILIGGGFGAAQRDARCRRVRRSGVIYELVSQNTLEVGRAHRWRGETADGAPVVHQG